MERPFLISSDFKIVFFPVNYFTKYLNFLFSCFSLISITYSVFNEHFSKLNSSLSFVNTQLEFKYLQNLMTIDELLRNVMNTSCVMSTPCAHFSRCEKWLAQVDSNHRPRAYQARALTT